MLHIAKRTSTLYALPVYCLWLLLATLSCTKQTLEPTGSESVVQAAFEEEPRDPYKKGGGQSSSGSSDSLAQDETKSHKTVPQDPYKKGDGQSSSDPSDSLVQDETESQIRTLRDFKDKLLECIDVDTPIGYHGFFTNYMSFLQKTVNLLGQKHPDQTKWQVMEGDFSLQENNIDIQGAHKCTIDLDDLKEILEKRKKEGNYDPIFMILKLTSKNSLQRAIGNFIGVAPNHAVSLFIDPHPENRCVFYFDPKGIDVLKEKRCLPTNKKDCDLEACRFASDVEALAEEVWRKDSGGNTRHNGTVVLGEPLLRSNLNHLQKSVVTNKGVSGFSADNNCVRWNTWFAKRLMVDAKDAQARKRFLDMLKTKKRFKLSTDAMKKELASALDASCDDISELIKKGEYNDKIKLDTVKEDDILVFPMRMGNPLRVTNIA